LSQFPTDPKKLKARIRSYERSLAGEVGHIDDSYGKRYLLGPMYMLIGDVDGALKSFEWFESKFADDIGEPAQYLCWTLALLKNNLIKEAIEKLYQTMFTNLYLIPVLLGEKVVRSDFRHFTNWEHPEYATETADELFNLWSAKDKKWAREAFYSDSFIAAREKFIMLSKKLDDTDGSKERGDVISEIRAVTKSISEKVEGSDAKVFYLQKK
jgi:hypothetical protein